MDLSAGPNILELYQKPVNITTYDTKWIPTSARFVVLGSYARATGCLQIYSLDTENEGVKLNKELEKKAAFKCGTFGASSLRERHLATGNFEGYLQLWDLQRPEKPLMDVKAHTSIVNAIDGAGGQRSGYGPPELVTGGRDATARVWDVRTKNNVVTLTGHTQTVVSLQTQALEPQVISGSMDSTIRLWDLVAGRASAVLTNHKKAVRSVLVHPREYTFVSGAADNLKKWKCPEGRFLHNLSGPQAHHNAILHGLAVNQDDVLVSGADNGKIHLWDWKSGYNFQTLETVAQPGSLESEKGIYACAFDLSGSRLITGEADKTIKVWKEDPDATPASHPVDWVPPRDRKKY